MGRQSMRTPTNSQILTRVPVCTVSTHLAVSNISVVLERSDRDQASVSATATSWRGLRRLGVEELAGVCALSILWLDGLRAAARLVGAYGDRAVPLRASRATSIEARADSAA